MVCTFASHIAAKIYQVVFFVLVLTIGVSLGQEPGPAPLVSDRAVGAGHWQSSRDNRGNRDWQLQISRFDDDSIEGSLVIIGSPTLDKVRLEGRVDNGEVYGVLVGDADQQVGTFTGSVFSDRVSGTYTTADGDTGNWSWAGPAGARSLREKSEAAEQQR